MIATHYEEEDFLALSGLQHFAFCPRQWALIHLEALWVENQRTAEGRVLHAKAHDASASEKRGARLILRDLRVSSSKLGVSGACDVVEFYANPEGIPLAGRDGLWRPFPVEYKRGKPKEHQADELQLCCQAMCLEEMLCCEIACGALFYGETHRRVQVGFTQDLRGTVKEMLAQMHQYAARGYTPKGRISKACKACSLSELCLPVLCKGKSVSRYVAAQIKEEGES